MAREAVQYLAEVGRRFATGGGSEATLNDLRRELTLRDDAGDYLTGELSAVDLTVSPFIKLLPRAAGRGADFDIYDLIGPRLAAWIDHMQTLRSTGPAAAPAANSFNLTGRAALRNGEQSRRFANRGRSPTGTSE